MCFGQFEVLFPGEWAVDAVASAPLDTHTHTQAVTGDMFEEKREKMPCDSAKTQDIAKIA